jgi:flotillin
VADLAYNIQQEVARKELETEKAAAEMVRLEKETQLKAQQVQIERERLSVEIRELAEANYFKAQKEAEAALVVARNEAEGIRLKGEAEAAAILKKAEAMKEYGQAAILEMVVNRLPEIAKAVSEPLSKTEKIILFGDGGATHMARDVSGAMLQTFESVKEAVGVDIPKMLRDVTTGGLVGKAAEAASES